MPEAEFVVVVNDEEQYSIWEAGRSLPDGWSQQGAAGSRERCLDWIEENWTDITPKSART